MSVMASQITSLMVVYLSVYSGADQRKHQRSASLAFVWGIHRWIPRTNGPVTRKMFPFDGIIMRLVKGCFYIEMAQNISHFSFFIFSTQWNLAMRLSVTCKLLTMHITITHVIIKCDLCKGACGMVLKRYYVYSPFPAELPCLLLHICSSQVVAPLVVSEGSHSLGWQRWKWVQEPFARGSATVPVSLTPATAHV